MWLGFTVTNYNLYVYLFTGLKSPFFHETQGGGGYVYIGNDLLQGIPTEGGSINDMFPFESPKYYFVTPVNTDKKITEYFIIDEQFYYKDSIGLTLNRKPTRDETRTSPLKGNRIILLKDIFLKETVYWNGSIYFTISDKQGLFKFNEETETITISPREIQRIMPVNNYLFYLYKNDQIGFLSN